MTTVHIETKGSPMTTKISVDGVDITKAIRGFKLSGHASNPRLFTVQLEAFASLDAEISVEKLDIVEVPREA